MAHYLIDENITPALCHIFESQGLVAHHINEFKAHSKQRIIDDQLRRLSLQKGFVIVTKDDDFVKSYVHRKVPEKMIFLYDLHSKHLLLDRMASVLPRLERLMHAHDFLEINPNTIRTPFS